MRVHDNRSAESNATLYAGNGTALFTFRVRAHGHSNTDPNTTWPDFTDDVGINQFTSMGNTPTGAPRPPSRPHDPHDLHAC